MENVLNSRYSDVWWSRSKDYTELQCERFTKGTFTLSEKELEIEHSF